MEQKKKISSSMYELLAVNEMKPLNEGKEKKDNQTTNNSNTNSSSPSNITSLSGFLNSVSQNNEEINFHNKTPLKKGDFYTDPELIQKNCELFPPETIKNNVQAFVLFNSEQRYKGILFLTEYRLIFKEKNPINAHIPENYFKYPLMSIAKLEKIQNPKSDYDTYVIEITLKDTRIIRFYVKDNIKCSFYFNLESSTFPKDIKNLYIFTELYHNEIKKEKNYFNGWGLYDPIREFSREGVTEDNNLGLRFCYAKNRLPIMAYYYYNPNSDDEKCVPTIWRSAQNKGGLMGSKKMIQI